MENIYDSYSDAVSIILKYRVYEAFPGRYATHHHLISRLTSIREIFFLQESEDKGSAEMITTTSNRV